jgi:hypothetical protein
MHWFQSLCFGILISLLAASPAYTQGSRRTPVKRPELPKFNLSGRLEHIELGRIELKTEAGYDWVLMPKRGLKVELTGKSKPAILAPGQFVEFLAKVDVKRGTAMEKIERMTIFTPDKRRMPGIMPDLGFGDLEKATLKKRKGTSAPSDTEHQQPSSKSASSNDKGNEKGYVPEGAHQSKPASKGPNEKIESFTIHGKIQAIAKNGKITVQVPENPYTKSSLTIEVADDADIDVELNDVSALLLVQPGDHIQASGDQTGEGMGITDHVTMRLERVLGIAPPPKKSPPKTGRAAQAGDSHL